MNSEERMSFEEKIKLEQDLHDTYLIWYTPLQSLVSGDVCIILGGSPVRREAQFLKGDSDFAVLVPKFPKRETENQIQTKYRGLFAQREVEIVNYDNNLREGKVDIQYFFKVEEIVQLEIIPEQEKLKHLINFIHKYTVYSRTNLENYFPNRIGSWFHIFIGRLYSLSEIKTIKWELSKTAMSNVLASPRNFEGVEIEGEEINLVPLKPEVNYSKIHDKLMELKEKMLASVEIEEVSIEEIDILDIDMHLKEAINFLQNKNFVISDRLKSTLYEIAIFLSNGYNIILSGRPGTGKTTIAEAFAFSAKKMGYISHYEISTATSNWTAYETVGGYVLNKDQELEYNRGIIHEALVREKWLILDELNRADIDKSLGSFFSVLSGQEVTLFERDDENEQIIIPGFKPLTTKFRLIGTMNTADKASLFQLSYAFRRRFKTIEITFDKNDIDLILNYEMNEIELNNQQTEAINNLSNLWDPIKFPNLTLGPALLIDFIEMADYLKELNTSSFPHLSIEESIRINIFDHLDILSQRDLDQIKTLFEETTIWENLSNSFKKYLERKLEELGSLGSLLGE